MWTRKGWVIGFGLVVMGGIGSGDAHADPPRVRVPHHCAPHGFPGYVVPGGPVVVNRPIFVAPYAYGVPAYGYGHSQRYGAYGGVPYPYGGVPYGSYYRGTNGMGTRGWPVGPSFGGGGFPSGPSFGGSGWGISIYGR